MSSTNRIIAKLTNTRNGRTTTVRILPPSFHGGMWHMSERARRSSFARIGAEWEDPNAGVISDKTIRAVDTNGWHTYTIWTQ